MVHSRLQPLLPQHGKLANQAVVKALHPRLGLPNLDRQVLPQLIQEQMRAVFCLLLAVPQLFVEVTSQIGELDLLFLDPILCFKFETLRQLFNFLLNFLGLLLLGGFVDPLQKEAVLEFEVVNEVLGAHNLYLVMTSQYYSKIEIGSSRQQVTEPLVETDATPIDKETKAAVKYFHRHNVVLFHLLVVDFEVLAGFGDIKRIVQKIKVH